MFFIEARFFGDPPGETSGADGRERKLLLLRELERRDLQRKPVIKELIAFASFNFLQS
jgi:hypothetical protein